ncbi:MAG TPA: ankyrin repeat domain-containing protein [Vicinamibacterales bacterium]|nr:ankyrin repeat domain-containing protein [Vicinamibacterales bacterium]
MKGARIAVTLIATVVAFAPLTLGAADNSLLDAAERGDRSAVLGLLAKGANPNVPGPDGTTAIMWAAANDDVELVRALIKAGADVKLENQFGTSALTEAAIIGSARVVDVLIKAGADPNTKNPEGETPLMAVARSGKVEAAKLLLEAGADINAREKWGGQSALMWAAAQSQPEMVKLLASKGADLNARGVIRQWERKVITEPRQKDMNKGGYTALLYAAREGCVECAQHLVAAGADPDLEDPDRATPLNMALLNLHFELAAYLIKAGADVDKWDLYGRSPLYMAADVSTLPTKGNGAMAVIPSDDSVTALDVAKLLLDAGANPNLQLKRRPPYRDVPQDRGGDSILAQGATPLLRAARAGDAPFVELLLKHKALVDLPSKEGVTPLMAAAGVDFGTRVTRGRNRTTEGVLATMRLLLDAGAEINARMVTEPRRAPAANGAGRGAAAAVTVDGGASAQRTEAAADQGAAARAAAATGRGGRASQVPSALAVPHQTALHGAAERGFTPLVKFLADNGADLQAKDANGRTALDLARGTGATGRGQAESFPETAALLESLMAAKGIKPSPAK